MKTRIANKSMMLLGALALMVAGCADDDFNHGSGGPGNLDVQDYAPLAMGMQWTYKKYNAAGAFELEYTAEILGSHTFAPDMTVYFVVNGPGWYTGYAKNADGLFFHWGNMVSAANIIQLVSNPPEVGDILEGPDGSYCKVLSLDATQTCALGTFDCLSIEYRWPASPNRNQAYLAKDIGVIRYNYFNADGVFQGHDELEEYNAAGAN